MLTRMLLHVIAATVNVNQTVNPAAFLNRSCILQNVEDLPVVSFGHLGHAQSCSARLAGRIQPVSKICPPLVG